MKLFLLQGPIGPELFLIFGIIYAILTLIVSYFVYNDAKKQDNENAILWALLVGGLTLTTFIGGLIALMIYLLVRER